MQSISSKRSVKVRESETVTRPSNAPPTTRLWAAVLFGMSMIMFVQKYLPITQELYFIIRCREVANR